MRHQKSGRRLGKNATHRKAMWSNMVASLITHERIEKVGLQNYLQTAMHTVKPE